MKDLQKRTWAEVSLENIEHNYRAIRARLPKGCRFLGIVKADAYGHGAVEVAKRLEKCGADYLAIACLDEALELRRSGVKMPILILGHTPPEYVKELLDNDLTQTVSCEAKGVEYSEAATKLGGTLDKLESVPGVSVEKSLDEFKRIVRKTGLCVIGQSGNLDPADKRMYALRDVSGTVPSIPLIASSIMSKKLASGAEAIVLDVKTGGGAFMRTVDEARKLASLMVKIGRHLGRNTVAVITDMDRPLGMAVGNGLEMREAIEGLTGKIPYNDPLMQVSFVLAGRLLMLSNIASAQEEAEIMLKKAVEDGSGFTRLRSMLEEMGGDVRYVDDPNLLVRTKRIVPIYTDRTGYIKKLDAKSIGLAALLLGAGREKAGDTVDPAVGILMKKRCGDRIEKDEPIAYMYVNDETNLDEAVSKLVNAVCVADEKPEDEALVYDIIE